MRQKLTLRPSNSIVCFADKAALLFSPFANAANIRTCGTPIAEMQLRSRKPPFDAAARPKSHAVISPHSDGTICTAEMDTKLGERLARAEPTTASHTVSIAPESPERTHVGALG
jgi:hypothetical protein